MKKYFIITILVFIAGFFLNTKLVQAQTAGCCFATAMGVCSSANSAMDCGAGTTYFDQAACITMSTCPGYINPATANSSTTTFANPLQINSVQELLTSLMSKLRGIIVIIAVIFMIIGGIMYMSSAGNEKMVTRAKQTWTGAVVGLAIALAAPAFLNEILAILQAGPDVAGTGSTLTIKMIAVNVLNFLLSIFGIIAIISLVIGGGMYLTAYGDEKRIDTAKKIITYAIIGIVVALSALVVVRQISSLISVS
ncbi:MAG TPA: TrbC/VirB2 family protein [Candidatus Moranbacteria bacterium]|nr:TrbC/VirB2 family protein [Candidatus Moranbacteria bacterium]